MRHVAVAGFTTSRVRSDLAAMKRASAKAIAVAGFTTSRVRSDLAAMKRASAKAIAVAGFTTSRVSSDLAAMKRASAKAIAVAWVLCALVPLAGCGSAAVEVPVPSPDPATARLCQALHDRLPGKVHGQERRTARPASDLTAAWGSPAIAVRCGVPRPPAMRQTSELVTINGLNWFPQPPGRPVTFTELGRRAYVEVTVPAKYTPQGDVLLELTAAIKAAIPAKPDGEL